LLIFYAFAVYLLRLAKGRIIISTRQRDVIKTPLGSMEEMIMKRSAAITGTLVVLFAVMSMVGQAQAGASASAPSKNSRSSQLASQQTNHNTAITEYSSSSRHSH
jgi:hypothetical protein